MNSYPRFAKIGERKYPINTDYKIAIECDEISRSNIQEEERALAILYKLYGERALNNPEDWEELLCIGLKFLRCGKEIEEDEDREANMSFIQDKDYIEASFFSDYNIDLEKIETMHWWKFYNLLCGLTENCVLNRVRFVRDYDISQIKDAKEREKWIKQKQQVALKREKTQEERRLDELFEKQLQKGR